MPQNEDPCQRFGQIARHHGPHFLFVLTILSLAALLVWWSIFIRNSIRDQRDLLHENYRLDLKYHVLNLVNDKKSQPNTGPLAADDKFEIIVCRTEGEAFCKPLDPLWPDLCLRIRPEVLDRVEDRFRRQNVMLIGEAGFLMLILLVSIVFLYSYIRMERHSALEVKIFWERCAHEIKTPITGIKAFLQNLKSEPQDMTQLTPYIDLALKQVNKQEKLADNILSGYQMKSGQMPLNLEELDLVDFLHNFFRKSSLQLAEATLKLEIKKEGPIMVKADRHALKVILDNIIDNAVKYSSPGLSLEVRILETEAKAMISIQDNGPGFPPRMVDNMFEAFKHLDRELPAGRRGTGMGLYISRQLAKTMGGNLKASSPGKGLGSEFRLTLRKAT